MKKIALYPGTFDPITNGHYDIIERALKLFDEVIVAVAISTDKKPMFTLQERINMTKEAVKNLKNVKVLGFDNLTVELARTHNATVLIRGLRAVSDFEYELQLGYLNNSLDDKIETVYLMPKLQHAFISSSIVRNLLKFNAKTEHLVPKEVQEIITEMKSCTLQ
ncbi:MAG: pantetheine-phosphate adenylyltransferase [Sulfurimonas sp. RIFOXYD12_FULL_33_39]|uniref:pantetheine-phosphate adenylyltransferase n=1 Tax=unclassified Sulfurimonas TaxID=2623549 RepID=UPI0008BCECE0|nr:MULTISPECIES: pantetheine-phosphate adenylyltransferase [unclassified Sulfurimonas]OHE01581.1 MAG: pantetheine-phosphate adenylyltransferase [Sulfurimonas sp. RIFCSPLOWO2_12_FULL_34_6]OHE09333.1 MAG: pantetheine-phosphate adenylyltransferase [Sulfurimonas sp. RIFOXYD12_FULL_33_39]OHE12884.1 MAG: pantetheine-phosphate adenylyltransferase [Sulfurimonas sp. RIFOXYD2_FULL_34_21]DAB27296.1 MAG TPA: pantetheine-phosphate adenylyltransferase [Sulfurimonas sp. UBA10385]